MLHHNARLWAWADVWGSLDWFRLFVSNSVWPIKKFELNDGIWNVASLFLLWFKTAEKISVQLIPACWLIPLSFHRKGLILEKIFTSLVWRKAGDNPVTLAFGDTLSFVCSTNSHQIRGIVVKSHRFGFEIDFSKLIFCWKEQRS